MNAINLVKEIKADLSRKAHNNRQERTARNVAKALTVDLQVRSLANWFGAK